MPYISKVTPLRSADPEVILLIAKWAVGATGAVGAIEGAAVTSVVRNSTGQYTVVFKGRGPLDVLAYNVTPVAAGDADLTYVVESIDETLRTIVVQFQDHAGAPADPPNGGQVCLMVFIQNTTSSR